MSERNEKLVLLIADNLGDVSDIQESDNEIYFKFKGHSFSIMTRVESSIYMLYAYPKWRYDMSDLISLLERGATDKDGVFVKISDSNTNTNIAKIYIALKNQSLGIDDLFNDLGIQ